MTDSVPPAHPFDLATRLEPEGEHVFRARTSPDYANMVGPFGGVTAATMLNAVWSHPQRQGEPIALTVNFAGPLEEGDFVVTARPARTNRSTQHWTIDIVQGGQVAATATAVFAVRRETWSSTEAEFPTVPPASAVESASHRIRAAWPRCYDMRFVRGPLSLDTEHDTATDSVSTLWIRDEPPRPVDFVSLTALCDAFFPRIFVRRPKWVPIGTVTLTIYYHCDASMLAAHGERELLGTARALQFRNGYFDQTAEVWSPAGELFATTHQAVYYRE
jgi:acyl-coenzyme A thioesterase PaaI-like protein